ncbi:MAG TPA: hypothetical protein DHW10_00430 [Rhodospirillaceae bacterium]|nr:hypothetical protein [Rhodospirillaceae bacterium]
MTTSIPVTQIQSSSANASAGTGNNSNQNAIQNSAFIQTLPSGQNSFLALLLGQIDGSDPIDISSLGINFETPSANSGAASINQNLKSLVAAAQGDNAKAFETQISALANNQERILGNNQKIQEFLQTLIEQAQSVSGKSAGFIAAPVFDGEAAANAALNGIIDINANESGAKAGENNIITAIASLLNGKDGTQANNNGLMAQISALVQQNPKQLIDAASLISSGLSIEDMGKIQDALASMSGTTGNASGDIEIDSALMAIFNGEHKGKGIQWAEQNPAGLQNASQGATGAATTGQNAATRALSAMNGTADGSNSAQLGQTSQNAPTPQATAGAGNAQFAALIDAISAEQGLFAKPFIDQGLDPSAVGTANLSPDTMATKAITNPQLSVPHASQAHAASQNMAVQIQKVAMRDGSSRFVLELDPPQLGKVDIELRVSKDNSLKAHMIIDKPETYMMLQRDSGVLQKALQEMGLDVGAEDLSFSLAQDSQNGAGDTGSGNNNSPDRYAGYSDGQPSEVIETSLSNIYVDPSTGFVRVNIVA